MKDIQIYRIIRYNAIINILFHCNSSLLCKLKRWSSFLFALQTLAVWHSRATVVKHLKGSVSPLF